MDGFSSSKGSSFLQVLLSLALVVGIVYFAKPVIVPLALAIMLAFILTPIVTLVQGNSPHRVPAVLVTVALTLSVFGVVGWGVGIQLNELAIELPKHKERIQHKLSELRGSGDGVLGQLLEMIREIDEEPQKGDSTKEVVKTGPQQIVVVKPDEPTGLQKLAYTVLPVLEPLATMTLVIILVIFMLINREDLRNRLIGLFGHGHLTATTRAIVDAAHRVSRYLLSQLLVNIGFGVVFGICLLLIGVPYAFLWAFLTAIMRFVPYVGTWLAASFPFLLSFALAPSWTQPVLVVVCFATLDILTANVLEPLLFGHSTGVTPIALLIAAAFWTWIWGPIGLVLSTPLTVCLVVLGQHVPRFRFLSLLLGSEPPLKPHVLYYQRLLAKDTKEATLVATEQVRTGGLEGFCDEVLVPALALARRARKQGELTADEEEFIFTGTREVLDQIERDVELTNNGKPKTGVTEPLAPLAPLVKIMGCPAHDEGEELLLSMLRLLLHGDGCQVETISTKTLPSEVEERIAKENPALVFIPILPPGGVAQARFLCKRLRKRFVKIPIIVTYGGDTRHFDKLLVSMRVSGATYVTTSLLQTRRQILTVVAPGRQLAPIVRIQPTGAV